jgi:hypothetical protein
MRLRKEQSGFVLSGTALLLVLPAMLLVASLLNMVEIGGETTSLQAVADKVVYTGYDLERVIKYMDKKGLPINSESLGYLADNYRASTGLLVDLPGVVVYPMRIHIIDTGVDHYAGTKYCRITEIAPGVWEYGFEDKDEVIDPPVDWDYNEPRLLVERIGENIKITVLAYEGGYHAEVYYENTRIFAWVGGPQNWPPAQRGIGLTAIVENAIKLNVPVFLRDPRGVAWYSATVELA